MTEWEEFMIHQEGACQPRECPLCQIQRPLWDAYFEELTDPNNTKNEGEQNG